MIRNERIELPGGQQIALRVREAVGRQGASVTLLCLHGMPGRGADFDPLLRALPADWCGLAPDRAGYGASRPLSACSRPGPEAEAERLLAILDALGVDRVLLLAWSWAGLVASAVGRRAPERLRGLLLVGAVGPAMRFPRDVVDRLLFRSPVGDRLLAGSARHLPGLLRRALDEAYGEAAPDELFARLLEDAKRPCTRGRWLADGRMLRPETMTQPPAGVPTWLLHGSADRSVPVAVARDSALRRPATRLVELDGVGHWPFRTATRATVDTLVELAAETRP